MWNCRRGRSCVCGIRSSLGLRNHHVVSIAGIRSLSPAPQTHRIPCPFTAPALTRESWSIKSGSGLRRYGTRRQSNRTLTETESPKKQLACSLGYGRATEKRPICAWVMCLFHAPATLQVSKLGIFRHGLWGERLFYNLRVERL
jgi:hypothetical protein